MKPYSLYDVELLHNYRHITTVSARSADEANRKAWKKIAKKNPGLVPFFRVNEFVCIHQSNDGWGKADFG